MKALGCYFDSEVGCPIDVVDLLWRSLQMLFMVLTAVSYAVESENCRCVGLIGFSCQQIRVRFHISSITIEVHQ
jgi:hypothetical protein